MAHIAKPHLSNKHLIIKKANLVIIIAVSVAVFVTMFSIFAARALFSQASYHQNVINQKKDALKIAKDNSKNAQDLEKTYVSFATESINVLGGNPLGTGPQDGLNPKIVLDSLPSEYDYPALSSSIEKLLVDNGYQINRIGGSEDSKLSNTSSTSSSTVASTLTEISYPLAISSTAEGSKNLLDILERSIRPFYVTSLELSGSDESMSTKISMDTFYQPAISFEVTEKAAITATSPSTNKAKR